jgi:pSer/pThr/pTyr-binding forkhead associated (FHA) protein
MLLRRLDTGDRIALTSEAVTIGRSTDRDVVVDDNRVSRHHAIVAPHGSGWIVTDGRSSNGTRLNGTALEANRPSTLRAGDSIEIGPVTFRFEVDEQRAPASDSPADVAPPTEATSVLDDATRQRISGEYQFPPDAS